MRKSHSIALALLAGALAFALTGCGTKKPYEVATETGGQNASALAAENAKSRWRILYEEACADGYTGGYVEFLKEIGGGADESAAVNSALMSTVEVYAGFRRAQTFGEQSEIYYSVASGIFYSVDREKGNAYVITNYHVLYSDKSDGRESLPHISDSVTLYLYGGKTNGRAISAEYVGGACEYDVAVLKVEGSETLKESGAAAIVAGSSDEAVVGERVFAVGNPDNKGISAVSGILSVGAEYISGNVTNHDGARTVSMLEMRTDAPVNHGNSGGGLFDAEGRLIGLVNARSEAAGVEHLGYAIPADLALAVAQNIIDNSGANDSKGALRATLGVTVQVADSRSVYDEAAGCARVVETVVVKEATPGSPAYGKFETGDILLSMRIGEGEEKPITRLHMLGNEMFKVRKGNTVWFALLRGGKRVETSVQFTSNNQFSLFD